MEKERHLIFKHGLCGVTGFNDNIDDDAHISDKEGVNAYLDDIKEMDDPAYYLTRTAFDHVNSLQIIELACKELIIAFFQKCHQLKCEGKDIEITADEVARHEIIERVARACNSILRDTRALNLIGDAVYGYFESHRIMSMDGQEYDTIEELKEDYMNHITRDGSIEELIAANAKMWKKVTEDHE